MQIEIFTLCDAATKDGSGKLNIFGTFNIITTKQVPIKYPPCSLAIKLRFEKTEEGNKTMKISFIDTNGNPILPAHDQTFIVRTLPEEPTANISLVVLIPQIKLKNFGEYSINIAIDDCPVGSTLFYVRKVAS
jgi:hypothetical protein